MLIKKWWSVTAKETSSIWKKKKKKEKEKEKKERSSLGTFEVHISHHYRNVPRAIKTYR